MPDKKNIELTIAPFLSEVTFGFAFSRFLDSVKNESGESFKDFGSGLPLRWEGYKEWVYHEGRRVLDFGKWKKKGIGQGEILNATIKAIELHQNSEYRNNLVQWDRRYGPESRSHKRLLDAQNNPADLFELEKILFTLYRGSQSDEESVFNSLSEKLNRKYDLLAYLFFLKDWTRFIPIKPVKFSKALEKLGMPLTLSGRCSWENYQGYLERINLVRNKLSEYRIPGNRLIDAHSFCWILISLWDENSPVKKATWIKAVPESASKLAKSDFDDDRNLVKTPEDFLDESRQKQFVGANAQLIVFNAEKRKLLKEGKKQLADAVKDVSENPSLGYDIESFEVDGSPKRIEVKAVSASKDYWRFYLSENELLKSKKLNGYVFALVNGINSKRPQIWEFPAKQLPESALKPVVYKVYLKIP